MSVYALLLVLKLLAVMTYSGGVVASFIARDEEARKTAVHRVASPSLLATWCLGYGLALHSGVRLFELWIVSGLALSLLSNIALVHAVVRGSRGVGALVRTTAPLVGVVVVMVTKPHWPAALP